MAEVTIENTGGAQGNSGSTAVGWVAGTVAGSLVLGQLALTWYFVEGARNARAKRSQEASLHVERLKQEAFRTQRMAKDADVSIDDLTRQMRDVSSNLAEFVKETKPKATKVATS